jgi:hypothetical protein
MCVIGGPTTCCSSNQRHAQQLAQRCLIVIDPTRHTKCQHVINHLKQNIKLIAHWVMPNKCSGIHTVRVPKFIEISL